MRLFASPSAVVVASGLARRNVQDGRGIIDGDFDDTHGAGEEGREIQYNDSTRLLDPKGYRKRNRTARTERRTRARRKRLFFRAVSAYVSVVVPYSRKWMGWMYFCSVLHAVRGSPRARLLHQGGPTGAGKCGDCFTLGPGPIMWLDDAAKRSPCESASLGCLHEQPDRSMISIMLNRLTCGMALPRLGKVRCTTQYSALSASTHPAI